MNWSEIFPILDDSMLVTAKKGITAAEKVEFDHHFGIAETLRGPKSRERDHWLSISLFWKHVQAADPDLPHPTRELVARARRLGLVKRFSPWKTYLEPLYLHTAQLLRTHPEVEPVCHLAHDLDFLVPDLLDLGWTVRLMRSDSLRYCPGGFWRFLALEEPGKLVTIVDSDRIVNAAEDIQRTAAMAAAGLSLWRVPGYYHARIDQEIRYRPILGGHFGAQAGLFPIRALLDAFLWHWQHDTLPRTAQLPVHGETPIKFAHCPDYGFDEWFLLAALYPRYAHTGILSFVPMHARSQLLPIDLTYAQWANPKAEMVYF